MKIAILGNPGLNERLKKTLGEEVQLEDITNRVENRSSLLGKMTKYIKEIRPYDCIILYAHRKMWKKIIIAKMLGKKVIIYWIGTDCYHLQNDPKSFLIKKGDINIAHSRSLQKELEKFSIETDILTILPQGIDLSMGTMPKTHAVLFYIPEGREEFYGYKWIQAIIDHFADLPFHIVANGKKDLFPQKNAIVHGKISLQEMAKLYNEISIVIRFPEHDSLSISIMEAMFKAKIIIYRYEQECTIQAKTLEEMIQRIEEQIQNPPHYNIAAREYALNHFTEETVRSQFRIIKEKYNLK